MSSSIKNDCVLFYKRVIHHQSKNVERIDLNDWFPQNDEETDDHYADRVDAAWRKIVENAGKNGEIELDNESIEDCDWEDDNDDLDDYLQEIMGDVEEEMKDENTKLREQVENMKEAMKHKDDTIKKLRMDLTTSKKETAALHVTLGSGVDTHAEDNEKMKKTIEVLKVLSDRLRDENDRLKQTLREVRTMWESNNQVHKSLMALDTSLSI